MLRCTVMASKNKPIHTFVVLAYKESPYLEECVRSVLNQRYSSKVVVATSTPNDYIQNIADKYDLLLIVRDISERGRGAASDFDFALSVSKTKLTTIVNHDEIYSYDYSFEVVQYYETHPNACIIFSKYYDIKPSGAVYTSLNFIVKHILLLPLALSDTAVFTKRLVLRFGNPIGCPATTFVKPHYTYPVFAPHLKAAFDYWAWEKLSRTPYAFGYIRKPLMGHRIHSASITSTALGANLRTKEDIEVLAKFWPLVIAKAIASVYRLGEKNNG